MIVVSRALGLLLGLCLTTFQVVVLVRYPTGLAAIMVLAAFAADFMRVQTSHMLEARRHFQSLVDYKVQFGGCAMHSVRASAYVDEETRRVFEELSIAALMGFARTDLDDLLRVIEVEPVPGSVIPTAIASYNATPGGTVIFLLKPELPLHPVNKFCILHELGHSRYFSNAPRFEITMLRGIYALLLIWSAIAMQWSLQPALLWSATFLMSLEFHGRRLDAKIRRAKLQAEINADELAVSLLNVADRTVLAARWAKDRRAFRDSSMSDDENSIRIERLLALLVGGGGDFQRFVDPMSNWEFFGRVLIIMLLATYAGPPAWWKLGALLLVITVMACVMGWAYFRISRVTRFAAGLGNMPAEGAQGC